MSDTSTAVIDQITPQVTTPAEASEAPYFAVSASKLAVMSVCTLGFYELYWFYKNWQLIKLRERTNIMPFWRAFFAIFFCYQCFSRIVNSARDAGVKTAVSAGAAAVAWIVVTLAWRLPDPYWLMSAFAFVPILYVQSVANELNESAAPHADRNSSYSVWNIVGIIFGGLMLVLVVIGEFLPD